MRYLCQLRAAVLQDSWNDMVQCDGYGKTGMKCVQMSPFTCLLMHGWHCSVRGGGAVILKF